jgi:hypothetical protein
MIDELEHNEIDIHKKLTIDSKSDEQTKERKLEAFKNKLLKKRETLKKESIIASKPSSIKSDTGIIFERMSNSSGMLDDSELAKDMGIFNTFDIKKE